MHHPAPRRITPAAACTTAILAAIVLALAAVPLFQRAGAATTYEFSLSKQDARALEAHRKAIRLHAKSAKLRASIDEDTRRIMAIEDLLAEAAGDEEQLRISLQSRLVEQYKSGGNAADWTFLLTSNGIGDAVDRASVLGDVNQQDSQLAAAHSVSAQRLEELQRALEDLRNVHGEQAAALEDHAVDLDTQLVAARTRNVVEDTVVRKGAGSDGTWFVLPAGAPGAMFAPAFMPVQGQGGPWNGGARTPARPSTPQQVAAVLADPRIEIYAGGRTDVASGRIDGRLLDSLRVLADQFGSVTVTSLISGHGVYTSSGNISAHSYGCAADIGSLSGIRIEPSTQGPGSVTERGVLLLAGMTGDLAPHQVISLNSYGGPTLAMGDHHDHIHLGYSC